ncbi:MAG: rhomboid family intramembrane serine protease [Pelagibacteraceae bacterium]|nr:rhomboid family intramembrane serine protease [Pelagibacteraceae bacterium]
MIPLKDDNPTNSTPIITYVIIGICVIVFLLEISSPNYTSGALFYSWGVIPASLVHNLQVPEEIYRVPPMATLITSMFMHGGFMHLIGNMLYMWIFADNIEDELGKTKFIIFYILSGIAAALTQVYMNTESTVPMVGASGAIGGVLGAYIVNHPRAKVLVLIPLGFFTQIIKVPAIFVLGIWFILQFVSSAFSSSSGGGVAYGAHIGGFIFGAIAILFFNRGVKRSIRKKSISRKTSAKIKNPWDQN